MSIHVLITHTRLQNSNFDNMKVHKTHNLTIGRKNVQDERAIFNIRK